jgi:hypothetical protein
MRKLTMHIPHEIATAIVRRHKGRDDITAGEARDAYLKMQVLWDSYQKTKKRLDWILDVFWEEQRIEQRFGTPVFYGAHRRLRNARVKLEDLHRDMFYLLVCTDGNYEPFSPTASVDAESIYIDFCEKYKRHL